MKKNEGALYFLKDIETRLPTIWFLLKVNVTRLLNYWSYLHQLLEIPHSWVNWSVPLGVTCTKLYFSLQKKIVGKGGVQSFKSGKSAGILKEWSNCCSLQCFNKSNFARLLYSSLCCSSLRCTVTVSSWLLVWVNGSHTSRSFSAVVIFYTGLILAAGVKWSVPQVGGKGAACAAPQGVKRLLNAAQYPPHTFIN